MAKSPDKPKKPRDYARPTRAKAHRPEAPAPDPSLDALLNPAIAKGRAGIGSGTGMTAPKPSFRGASEAREPGIHNHNSRVWIPGPALARRPGMTVQSMSAIPSTPDAITPRRR